MHPIVNNKYYTHDLQKRETLFRHHSLLLLLPDFVFRAQWKLTLSKHPDSWRDRKQIVPKIQTELLELDLSTFTHSRPHPREPPCERELRAWLQLCRAAQGSMWRQAAKVSHLEQLGRYQLACIVRNYCCRTIHVQKNDMQFQIESRSRKSIAGQFAHLH